MALFENTDVLQTCKRSKMETFGHDLFKDKKTIDPVVKNEFELHIGAHRCTG